MRADYSAACANDFVIIFDLSVCKLHSVHVFCTYGITYIKITCTYLTSELEPLAMYLHRITPNKRHWLIHQGGNVISVRGVIFYVQELVLFP